jgi:Tfp pilus assembly protein PilN
MMMPVLFAWIAVTVVLIGLVLYRGKITLNEEDQIFLDAAESHLAEEQRQIVAKAERITKPIHLFGWLSGGLALVLVILLVQDALKRF